VFARRDRDSRKRRRVKKNPSVPIAIISQTVVIVTHSVAVRYDVLLIGPRCDFSRIRAFHINTIVPPRISVSHKPAAPVFCLGISVANQHLTSDPFAIENDPSISIKALAVPMANSVNETPNVNLASFKRSIISKNHPALSVWLPFPPLSLKSTPTVTKENPHSLGFTISFDLPIVRTVVSK